MRIPTLKSKILLDQALSNPESWKLHILAVGRDAQVGGAQQQRVVRRLEPHRADVRPAGRADFRRGGEGGGRMSVDM